MTYQSYISKTRHNSYQFRITIPIDIRHLFQNKREIRRTLKTDSRKVALHRARFYWVQWQNFFEEVKKTVAKNDDKDDSFSVDLIMVPDETGQLITIDTGDVERDERMFFEYSRQKQQFFSDNPELFKPQLVNPPTEIAVRTTSHSEGLQIATFDEVYEKYLSTIKREKAVDDGTIDKYRTSFEFFSLVLANKPFHRITKRDAINCKEIVYKLPVRAKQKGLTGKKLLEVLSLPDNEYSKMAGTTIAGYLRHLKTLFEFAQTHEYISKNPMEGFTLPSGKVPETPRHPFNTSDLKKIFEGHVYQAKKARYQRYEIYHFWMPLLALYTGARLEELAQLLVSDVVKDESSKIWYVKVIDTSEDNPDIKKSLKNSNSVRNIPVHTRLIELGFLEYVREQHKQDADYLFNIKTKKGGKKGPAISAWFNRDEIRKEDGRRSQGYLSKCGVVSKGAGWSKVFHSFRHTFIDNLRQKGVDPSKIAAIVGHEKEYKITHNYGNNYNIELLKDEVEKLDFNISLNHLDFKSFLAKL